MPAAAAATPPTTSAPSLPMITSPSRAGSAVQSAVRISGAARVSVFCHENQLPNAPWYISAKASSGSTLRVDRQQQAEQEGRRQQGQHRDGDPFESSVHLMLMFLPR